VNIIKQKYIHVNIIKQKNITTRTFTVEEQTKNATSKHVVIKHTLCKREITAQFLKRFNEKEGNQVTLFELSCN